MGIPTICLSASSSATTAHRPKVHESAALRSGVYARKRSSSGMMPLMCVLLGEVSGVLNAPDLPIRERAQPEVVEELGRERGVLHRPHDPSRLGAEVLLETTLYARGQLGDRALAANRNLTGKHEHSRASRPARIRRQVGAAHHWSQAFAIDDPDTEDEDPHEQVQALDEDLANAGRPEQAQRRGSLILSRGPWA